MTTVKVAGNEPRSRRKGGKMENGGKGVGLLLKGWQATLALVLPIAAVGVMWGTTSTRLTHIENRALEDRQLHHDETQEDRRLNRELFAEIHSVLKDYGERIVRNETK